MYGISDINKEKKGLKEDYTLYRGLKISYIDLSFYERNINQIITFPSFTSCSSLKSKALNFSGKKKKKKKKKKTLIINIKKDGNQVHLI